MEHQENRDTFARAELANTTQVLEMLFDDFGIKVARLNFFTEEKMSEIEIKAKLEIAKEAA